MALPSTGSISMSQVNAELKKGETTVITLNDTDVRKLAGKTSGVISMNDLRGKSNTEYVENYQVFSQKWSGLKKSGEFTVTFPHKVVNGTINISTESYNNDSIGNVTLLGNTISGVSNRTISINNVSSISGTYYTGRNKQGSTGFSGGNISVRISFTGEWEA